MNKEQSILSDVFLENSMLFENKNNSNITSIKKVIKSNEKLKNLSDIEVRNLLHIIRKEQVKLHSLLIDGGEEILKTHDTHIEDFLNDGGFQKIYKDRLNELYFKRFLLSITLLTFLILIYSTFFQEVTIEKPKDIEKLHTEQEATQKKIKKDSLENHYRKSTKVNYQNNSLN